MNPLTIITPCSRPENLQHLKQSIKFDQISQWIIVHDNTKSSFQKVFNHPKILELSSNLISLAGHAQRNLAIEKIAGGLIYNLDDDNIIHPNFWRILPSFSATKINLFNVDNHPQFTRLNLLNPGPSTIDTSMFCFDKKLVGNVRWLPHLYEADGVFVASLAKRKTNSFKIFDETAAYYNYLEKGISLKPQKCPLVSSQKTAEIIIENSSLYSPETVKAAKLELSLQKSSVINKGFAYAQIRHLAENFRSLILPRKKVYIRGAGKRGQNDLATCKLFGIKIEGFIVSDTEVQKPEDFCGLPVYYSSNNFNKKFAYILISSSFFPTIEMELETLGWEKDKDFTTLF